jgi:hypothetical protein
MRTIKSLMVSVFFIFLVSASCNNEKETYFKKLNSAATGVNFVNKLESHALFNILYYLYYYNGGGVAVGDVNNDGMTDIFFTANIKGGNKLFLNKGNFRFEDVTLKARVSGGSDWNTGATMADVNGDGYLDIYVSSVNGKYGLNGHNEMLINDGTGKFSDKSIEYGLDFKGFTTQSAFFDYDHDGDLDCYILNQSHQPHANIVDTINRNKYDSLSGDRLYRNDLAINGKFTDVSKEAGIYQSNLGYGLGLGVADINNDGWEDVYVGNDFHENDYYYVNNGNGTFTESGSSHFDHYSRFSMGNDIADYNNDGQLDIITVDMLPPDEKVLKTYGSDENADIYRVKLGKNGYQEQFSKNCLQRNNGDGGSFSETALLNGVAATDWSWAPLFADFDNDGLKDLIISSGIVKRPVDLDYVRFLAGLKMKGMDRTDKFDKTAIDAMPDGKSIAFMFKGNGDMPFTDVSEAWGTSSRKGYYTGAAYADLDNDGDLDLVMNCIESEALILQNNLPKKNSLKIKFDGLGANRFGIGAKAYVFAQNKMQYQQLMLTRGFQSSVEPSLHFGLDSFAKADSVLIVWPDQSYQVIINATANQTVIAKQSAAAGKFVYHSFFPQQADVLTEYDAGVKWKHSENDFLDYNVQYLIPHAQSTRGPKIAVGDVNNDGLDDFYTCGARGQVGTLLIQDANGKFKVANQSVFAQHAAMEDVDAIFFDANKDSYPDLFVVSGGNEYRDDDANLADRLYINDGKGNFSFATNAIPPILRNKSGASSADFDKDGDIDILIGGLANSRQYGQPQSSYLIVNNGTGQFQSATPNIINLQNLGIVTSSIFTDINKDGWDDIVVAGEWMPVKIYTNNKGVFTARDIEASTGLWQTIFPADLNNDGHMDLLAGNWGLNSKLAYKKDGPLKLYVKDFDGNGSVEQIMAYTMDGQEYTFLAKDEIERSLPVMKKAYLTYSEVAGKTVQYMLYDLLKDYKELKAETLASSCFINDGKGGFVQQQLPNQLQLSPIMTFARGKEGNTFVAGGNFFDVIPYEGRYDARPLALFSYQSDAARYLPQKSFSVMPGQVRDLKWLRTGNNELLFCVARNNETVLFFK